MCMLDVEALANIVSKKPKFSRAIRKKNDDQFLSMKHGGTNILKHIPAHLTFSSS